MVVDFRYTSVSTLWGCRISSRSRKLMLLLCSCVGVNCRLGCVLLMCWWILSGVVLLMMDADSVGNM